MVDKVVRSPVWMAESGSSGSAKVSGSGPKARYLVVNGLQDAADSRSK